MWNNNLQRTGWNRNHVQLRRPDVRRKRGRLCQQPPCVGVSATIKRRVVVVAIKHATWCLDSRSRSRMWRDPSPRLQRLLGTTRVLLFRREGKMKKRIFSFDKQAHPDRHSKNESCLAIHLAINPSAANFSQHPKTRDHGRGPGAAVGRLRQTYNSSIKTAPTSLSHQQVGGGGGERGFGIIGGIHPTYHPREEGAQPPTDQEDQGNDNNAARRDEDIAQNIPRKEIRALRAS